MQDQITVRLPAGALLVPSTAGSLKRVRALLNKYADLPMDYADATLVALAEELGTAAFSRPTEPISRSIVSRIASRFTSCPN